MIDKKTKEMIQKLFDLTLEIESKEDEIKEYEENNKAFPPLNLQCEVINKTHKMYEICKEYLYS